MSTNSEMEKKLAEYRAKKDRDALINKTKTKFKGLFNINTNKKDDNATQKLLEVSNTKEDLSVATADYYDMEDDLNEIDDTSLNCFTYVDVIYYTLCFILWVTLYAVFIKLEFGTIYFIVTAFIGMYLNTGTGRKHRNQVSAYSVFNKNCESIDGTLKGEQLERQLIYGQL